MPALLTDLDRWLPRVGRWLPWLALVLACVFLLLLPESERISTGADFAERYSVAARNLISGEGLTWKGGEFFVRHPPIYPLLLAPVFAVGDLFSLRDITSAQLLNAVLFALNVQLVLLLGRRVLRRFAALPAFLWTFYLPALWMVQTAYSETLFITLTLTAVLIWMHAMDGRRRWLLVAALAGLVFGLAMLTRPIGLFTPILLLLTAFWWKLPESTALRRLSAAAVLAGGVVVAVTPWQMIMEANMSDPPLLAGGGPTSAFDGVHRGIRDDGRGFHVSTATEAWLQGMYDQREEIETMGEFVGMLLRRSLDQPLQAAEFFLIKAVRAWYGTDSGSKKVEWLLILVHLALWLLALPGLWRFARDGDRQRWNFLLAFAAALFGIWAMNLLVVPLARYTFPLMPMLILLACVPLTRFWEQRVGGQALDRSA